MRNSERKSFACPQLGHSQRKPRRTISRWRTFGKGCSGESIIEEIAFEIVGGLIGKLLACDAA